MLSAFRANRKASVRGTDAFAVVLPKGVA